MNWVFDAISQAVGVFGGAAAAAALLSAYVGRILSNQVVERLRGELSRDLETHRIRLKKSEIFFEQELNAAKIFVAFTRRMMPRFRHPLMDWHETCDRIASNFESHENFLDSFLADHGAIISDAASKIIVEASVIASEFKFEAIDDGLELDVSPQANEAAEQFYNKVKEAERALLKSLRNQIAM